MATPTKLVTRRVHDYLAENHDVILALRVEWGPDAVASRKKLGSAFWAQAYLWTPIVLPIIALLRRPDTRKVVLETDSGFGILALTADDGRILLSTAARHRKTPTGVAEVLPRESPLEVDLDSMETHLVPALTVGHRELVVNSIDFKALLKAVEDLKVRSREIKAALPRLRDIGKSPYGAPTRRPGPYGTGSPMRLVAR